jgi:hypothetical protein
MELRLMILTFIFTVSVLFYTPFSPSGMCVSTMDGGKGFKFQEDIMIHPEQFRQFIKETLVEFERLSGLRNIASDDAVELLLLTAAQESHLGRYLWQVGKGPALGVFQVEPNTHEDIYMNYLRFKPEVIAAVSHFKAEQLTARDNMKGNLAYQVVVARLVYYRIPKGLPSSKDLMAMANYWKVYYNTHLGKGTVSEAVRNYKHFVEEERT